MSNSPVTGAGAAQWQALARILGPAFEHDPVLAWTVGGVLAMEAVFGRLAREIYLPRGLCYMAGQEGAAMWLSPGRPKALGVVQTVAAAGELLRLAGPRTIWRALVVDETMKARRPASPHFYLFAVGVLEHARGRGMARRLLAPVLARCDAQGIPAYLENSRAQNTSLYEGLGFVRRPEFIPASGCPPLMPMWREPVATPVRPPIAGAG